MIDDEVRAEITAIAAKDLESYPIDRKLHAKTKPVRIRYKGEWLVAPSGKTIWRTRAHAKNAMLCNERSPCVYNYDDRGYRLRGSNRLIGAWAENQEACRLYREAIFSMVEFVEVDGLWS